MTIQDIQNIWSKVINYAPINVKPQGGDSS